MLIQRVQVEKVIKLSPAWVSLFEFCQQHPFVSFKNLKFENGEPKIGEREVEITESLKF